ncbi:MAG: acetolactate synthase large subunit [Clostridia bacterium]|nr:acetolactate synthase large subunit [Clostridia bacterium]
MLVTGGELLKICLEREGVEYIFGMCGHSNIGAMDPLYNSSIRFISVRHEQIAAHAADGYFRVSHKPGVLLLHNGPGMTNALTGVGDAAADCSAMVIIAGDVPSHHFGRDCFQEIGMHGDASQYEIYKPLAKRAWRVNDLRLLPDVISRAFNVATSDCPGPVFISVPLDMWSKKIEVDLERLNSGERRPTGKRVRGDWSEIQKAGELLLQAHDPVIYVGGGGILSGASKEVLALAEYLGIPVATSIAGKGIIREDHILALGTTGRAGTRLANDFCKKADVILALGTRFSEQDSSSWVPGFTFNIPPTKLIQVDIVSREIGKIYPVEIGIVGDVKSVLEDLLVYIKSKVRKIEWESSEKVKVLNHLKEQWNKEITINQNSNAIPIKPERILKEVREALPEDGIIIGDVGWSKNGVSQQYTAYSPQTILMASGYGTMGFAAAAILGAKLGAPEKVVVSLTGDGGFSSVLPALITAVENNIPAVWIIFNNGCYSAIRMLQQRHYQGRLLGTEFVNAVTKEKYDIDWAKLAQVCGARGRRVDRPEDLSDAVKEAIKSKTPYVLDVIVDPEATVPATGFWDVHDIYEGKI